MFSIEKSITIQMNIRFKKKIDELTLVEILAGKVDPQPWIAHLHSLFTETPQKHLQNLIGKYGVGKAQLQAICASMPASYAQSCTIGINALAITA